jgi:hypothetical protein
MPSGCRHGGYTSEVSVGPISIDPAAQLTAPPSTGTAELLRWLRDRMEG